MRAPGNVMIPIRPPSETYQLSYQQQLTEKVHRLQALLAIYQPPPLACFASPVSHYRQRAEFRLWHAGDDLYQVMFDQQTRQWRRVDQFPVASELINHLITEIVPRLRSTPQLRHKLFRIDYHSTLSGAGMVSLLYHCQLAEAWVEQAKWLRDCVRATGVPLQLLGRARGQRVSLDQHYVDESLLINGEQFTYRQMEGGFTQPNSRVNCQMLIWACKVLAGSTGDLLELYCGNGNFTVPLAKHFRRIVATEVAKPSVEAAHYNLAVNQIDNVQIVRLSAQELIQAIKGVRVFNRLAGVDLSNYHFQTVLVDPPRCGLDEETLRWIQGYQQILYISCNPVTLCANLKLLSQTHAITDCALFDQFPYTRHIECGLLLRRREGAET